MSVSYRVVLSKRAEEVFESLMRVDAKKGRQVARAIDRLALNPNLGEFLKGDWKGYRKYRTGNYRIVYRVEHKKLIVFVVALGDRKDVYG